MNSNNRTAIFVSVALASFLLAAAVQYAGRPAAHPESNDLAQEFFPEFNDPLKASELSVVRYDSENREPISFSVRKNDKGLWTIPSHHDYPAEAEERLARTAASMIGIRKVALQSRFKDDWGRYGVADPTDESVVATAPETDSNPDPAKNEAGDQTTTKEPRGTRLTLKDSSGNPLVDLIIGSAVPGRDAHFYVRQPDKNPVFIAKMNVDLSAKFADWIEPDLLKINQPDINRVVVNRYSVDEEKGEIVNGELLDFSKDKTAGKWTLDGLDAENEQLKESAVTDLVRNLDQLKIVGVRPKPAGLNADLTVSEEVAANPLLRQVLQADMARQGFFIARGPQNTVKLVSNEGEVLAGTANGVRYTLYFGEIARGNSKDIEVGLNDTPADPNNAARTETPAEEPKSEAPKTPPSTSAADEKGPRRYLLVKVDYDEALLGPKPTEPAAPEKPAILLDAQPQPSPDKPAESKEQGGAAPSADPANCDEPAAIPQTDEKPAESKPVEPSAPEQQLPESKPADPNASDEKPAADKPADPAPPAASQDPANPAPGQETDSAPSDPKADAQKQYDQALGEYEAAKAAFPAALKTWEERAKEGQKRVADLSDRFSGWYYVITAESFEKFQLSRAAAVEPKSAAPTTPENPPGLPQIPGLQGLPGLPGAPGN